MQRKPTTPIIIAVTAIAIMAIFGLLAWGIFAIAHYGVRLTQSTVNCATFRRDTQALANSFGQSTLVLERKTTCIAGLDSHDQIVYTFAWPQDIAQDQSQVHQSLAASLAAAGWATGNQPDTFVRHAQAEKQAVDYTAKLLIIRNNPAVFRLTFSSSRDAFADTASQKEFPPDLSASSQVIAAYSGITVTPPSYIPAGYHVLSSKKSLTDMTVILRPTDPQQGSFAELQLNYSISTGQKDASFNCGGVTQTATTICSVIGITTSGAPVYAITSTSSIRYSSTYTTINGTRIEFINSVANSQTHTGLSTDDILRVLSSITPVI